MSLTEQIRAIEERFGGAPVRSGVPRENEKFSHLSTGWREIDAALGGGLTMAALHEWFGVAPSTHIGACRKDETQRNGWMLPLMPIVHLVRRAMSCASFSHRVAWIGRRCFPCGDVLIGADGDRRLLERSVFVAVHKPDDRLWAVDLALRCPTVGVVIADGSDFDMAATKRIQLVAKAHHTSVLSVRPPWEARELSAAQTRWLVRWGASCEQVDDETGLLNPRWSVELLRCKGRQLGSRPHVWALEWDRGEGVVRLFTAVAHSVGDAGSSTSNRRLQQA